ncbi:hypothetical protein CROQUDRAFT_43174 [Cronartium quercuum f. sp. fusiforme G11]|uniref:Kinetochore protein NDC80 n=1 Tax=Cronartium quercuum f. sp. fusiforme G11 TaxID=708437 RepID=A0A9P6NNG0_9BASI|nr:hypothetical protein CROQUDRAFT_43174 [Cronartium quercuum f. sp. fusiforme G11]
MDPRRRTITTADSQPVSNIPVPSSALKRQPPQTVARDGHRFSLAPQRAPSGQTGRQSFAPASSHTKYAPQSEAPFGFSQGASSSQRSNNQSHDPRRASVYQAPYSVARQSTSNVGGQSAGRVPMSANRPESGHHRYSSMNDVAAFNYPTTPAGSTGRPSLHPSSQHGAPGGLLHSITPGGALLGTPPIFKDPRPRDKKTVAGWQTDVYEFLIERGYMAPLTMKTLQTPTTKDFQTIFRFVAECADSGLRWTANGKKFEDEVLPLLKQMGYIAVDMITKSGLQAPGSMHTWPTMLAMLHWMVMTIKFCEEAMMSPNVRMDTTIEPSPHDRRSQQMAATSHWFEYIGRTYPSFLQTDDFDREQHKPPLEDFYQKQKVDLLSEIERSESRVTVQEAESARIKAKPSPLEAAQKDHTKLARDAEGFTAYVSKLKESINKSEKQNEALQKSLVATELKVKELAAKRAELAAKVEKQNITDIELQQISTTRTQLERAAAAAQTKRLQLTESMMDLEVKSSQASDRLEKMVTSYQNKAVQLGLIPRGPEPFDHVDFSQSVNGGAAEIEQMLPDPTVEIKPALVQLKKQAIESRLMLTDSVLSMEEKVLHVTENGQEKRENLQVQELAVQELTKQLEEDKEKFATEMNMMNEQTESILRRVNESESTRKNARMTMEHEIQALRVRYSETKRRIAQLTKENVDELNAMLGQIIRHKESVHEKTEMLKALAESMGDSTTLVDI